MEKGYKIETKNAYNRIAKEFSARNFAFFWEDELKEFKQLLNKGKIIDVGCGSGRDSEMLTNSGYKCVGVDFSEEMIGRAKNRIPEGTFFEMDFFDMKFADNTFDGFWAAASLLHVARKDIKDVLSEIKRIVKDDGTGFISIKEKRKLDEGYIDHRNYKDIKRYFVFYDQSEFANILKMSGFEVLKKTKKIEREKDGSETIWLCYFVKNLK